LAEKNTSEKKKPEPPKLETFVVVDRAMYEAVVNTETWNELYLRGLDAQPGYRLAEIALTTWKPKLKDEQDPDLFPHWERIAFFYKGQGRLAGKPCLRQQNWVGVA